MLHVRGTRGDYAAWERHTNSSEWSPASMAAVEDEYDHVISSSQAYPLHAIASAWVESSASSEWGRQGGGSYNTREYKRAGGVHYEHTVRQGTVGHNPTALLNSTVNSNPMSGKRLSTARGFLLPAMKRRTGNLDVLVRGQVTKVPLLPYTRDSLI